MFFFFFKQKTAYEMRISDWSSDGALPIYLAGLYPGVELPVRRRRRGHPRARPPQGRARFLCHVTFSRSRRRRACRVPSAGRSRRTANPRSEEHTSELKSLMRISYAVFCLKKKKTPNIENPIHIPKETPNRLN